MDTCLKIPLNCINSNILEPRVLLIITCLRCISRSGVLGWVTVGVPSIDFETDEIAVSALGTLMGTTEDEETTTGTFI